MEAGCGYSVRLGAGSEQPPVFPWGRRGHATAQKQHCYTCPRAIPPHDMRFNGPRGLSKRKDNSPAAAPPRHWCLQRALPPKTGDRTPSPGKAARERPRQGEGPAAPIVPARKCRNVGPASLSAAPGEHVRGRASPTPCPFRRFRRRLSSCLRAD